MAGSRFCLGLAIGVILSASAARAQELPTKSAPEVFDFEPQVNLLQPVPEVGAIPVTTSFEAAAAAERARTRLERARQKKTRWEKLARQGVLSKAEAERCAIEVSEALVHYERARVEQQQRELAALQQRVAGGSVELALVAAAEASLESAQQLAAGADAQFQQTRLRAAEVSLERHRRLFTERLVSRAQLRRAEDAVARLQATGGGK